MPLGEIDPNSERRFSRSPESSKENVGSSAKPAASDTLASGVGVASMLKTSTETGDLGPLTICNYRRLPKLPSSQLRRHNNHAPVRAPSSHYSRTTSLRSKTSNVSTRSGLDPAPSSWLNPSSAYANKENSQHVYSSLAAQESVRSLACDIRERLEQSERSMSLTHSIASHPERRLSNHRSLTSLRSATHALRPHSPLVRQGKLCRTRDYRPTSPALSDSASAQTRHLHRPQPGPRSHTAFAISTQPRPSYGHSPFLSLPTRNPQPSYSLYPGQLRPVQLTRPERGALPGTRLLAGNHHRAQNALCAGTIHDMPRDPGAESSSKQRISEDDTETKSANGLIPGQLARFEASSTSGTDAKMPGVSSLDRVESKKVPRRGFVERVRNALEEQISHEETNLMPSTIHYASHVANTRTNELHGSKELPHLDRRMIHNAVAVSPKSPGIDHSSSETITSGPPSETTVRRLTRELIKVGTGAAKTNDMNPETGFDLSDDLRTSISDSARSVKVTHEFQENNFESNFAGITNLQSGPSDTSCNDDSSTRVKSSTDLERSGMISFSGRFRGSFTSNLSAMKDQSHPPNSTNLIDQFEKNEAQDHITDSLLELGYSDTPMKTSSMKISHSDEKTEAAELSGETATDTFAKYHGAFSSSSPRPEKVESLLNEWTSTFEINAISRKSQQSSEEAGSQTHGSSPPSLRFYQHVPSESNMIIRESKSESDRAGEGIFTFDSQVHAQAEDQNQSLLPSHVDSNPTKQRTYRSMADKTPALKPEDRESDKEVAADDGVPSPGYTANSCTVAVSPHDIPSNGTLKKVYGSEHRYSISNNPNTSRFGLTDLTEDSQEDYSVTNLRILGARPPVFGSVAESTSKRNSRALKKAIVSQKQASSYLAQGIQDTLELPTLNFSRYDLTSKLNHALGIRSSRSFESLTTRRHRSSTVPLVVSEQLGSADFLRERYRSFFEFLEEHQETGQESGKIAKDEIRNATSLQPVATADSEILEEISRLSIPSVQTLSLRISALFPTVLKSSQSEADLGVHDGAVNRMVEQIQELGSAERLASMDLTKEPSIINSESALLFRNSTVNRGSSPVGEETNAHSGSTLDLMKELPPLPDRNSSKSNSSRCSRVYVVEDANPLKAKPRLILATSSLIGVEPENKHTIEAKELKHVEKFQDERPRQIRETKPEIVRKQSSKLSLPKVGSIDHIDERSLARPTLPENTFTSSSAVDETSLPAAPRIMQSSTQERPLDICSNASVRMARSMSPGFDSALVPVADPFSENDETGNKTGKKKVLGNLARRIGVKSNYDQAGFPINPHFLHPEERTVDAGDRYPTTSLTTPSALTLDGRSYFSDDSSVHKEPKSFRKRITRLNFRRSASRPVSLQDETKDQTVPRTSSHTTPWETITQGDSAFTDPNSVGTNDEVEPDIILMYERPAAGMSKTEFRAKRLLEKLRVLWTRGGRVFRTKHKKQNQPGGLLDSSDAYVVK